jgi:hypothetical protein
MWVRILAETGLLGFAVFLAWYYLLWRSSRLTQAAKAPPVLAVAGLAGQMALVAFLIEGFSIDSFALPYIWVSFGIISASGLLSRKEISGGNPGYRPGL